MCKFHWKLDLWEVNISSWRCTQQRVWLFDLDYVLVRTLTVRGQGHVQDFPNLNRYSFQFSLLIRVICNIRFRNKSKEQIRSTQLLASFGIVLLLNWSYSGLTVHNHMVALFWHLRNQSGRTLGQAIRQSWAVRYCLGCYSPLPWIEVKMYVSHILAAIFLCTFTKEMKRYSILNHLRLGLRQLFLGRDHSFKRGSSEAINREW